jgi:outer membrane protein TolC
MPVVRAKQPVAWTPKLEDIKGFVANQPITLDQAVAISLYASRNFATAVALLEQASARTGEARSQLFPSIGVNEQLTYYDKATTASLSGLTGGSASANAAPPLVVTPQFNPIFVASLSLPIDLFGTLRSAVSQAQFNEVAARIDINRIRNQTVYDVKTAFYSVLRASSQVAVDEDSLNNSLERLSDANKNYSAGTTSRFDITTAQRDVADAQQVLISAKAQVSVALGTLKITMGLDVTARLSIKNDGAVEYPPGVTPLVVAPSGPDGKPLPKADSVPTPGFSVSQNPEIPKMAPTSTTNRVGPNKNGPYLSTLVPTASAVVGDDFDFGPDYPGLLDEALKNRPEILEADAQVTASKRGLQYALRSVLPSFTFGVEDIYTANSTPLGRQNQEALTFGINVPIFDGGLARAKIREQRGSIAQAEVSRNQALSQVQIDVQQAYITLVEARERTAVSSVGVMHARESFRVSLVRYRAGVAGEVGVSPQLEVSNAQTGLALAESNFVNALYDYNNARSQLDRATGRYSFVGLASGNKVKSTHK